MTASPATAHPAGGEPSSILVRTPNWLGDLLMSTAFLHALMARFPNASVDLIVRQGFEVLPLPHRGRILPYHKPTQPPGKFGRDLRGQGYSHFFVLPPSLSSAWMAFRSGVPRRIGYAGGGRGWLLNQAPPYRHAHRSVHLVREYLSLLDIWGDNGDTEYFPLLEPEQEWCDAHLPQAVAELQDYVVLAPGAEFGPAKQWPLDHYRELAASLENQGRRVVVTGLAKDREAGDRILSGSPRGLNLCGDTDLPGLVAMLARAALLVSNDSGAMHIAAALRRPQIALFGSSNPAWTAPLNTRAEVLYRGLSCSPCYKRVCPLGHTNCLWEIAPSEVLSHAERLLASTGGA